PLPIYATRALTTKHDAQLSSGRVQTPTLCIIAQREAAIREFRPATFYEVKVKTPAGKTFTWRDNRNNSRIFDEKRAESLRDKVSGKEAVLTKVEAREKRQFEIGRASCRERV